MDTQVNFKSNAFKPFLPEDSQVNPEGYGAELAFWVCKALASKNIFTSYPDYEDWGWYIDFSVDENEYQLCCGNMECSSTEWQLSLEPYSKGLFGRNKSPIDQAKPLLDALHLIPEEAEEITDINWYNAL